VFCQQESGLLPVGLDAGEGRERRFADEWIVIHAQHRHFVGNRDVGGHAGVEHLARAAVHGGEKRDGFRQRLKPSTHARLFGRPIQSFFRRKGSIDRTRRSRGIHRFTEPGLTLPRPVEIAGVADIGETGIAPLQEIFGRRLSDGAGVE